MLRVGLTGGIGSGKSTVARRLNELGAVLIDADVLAREVVAPGTEGLAELVDRFGAEIIDDSGALDRPAMARLVFDDPDARAALNAVVHPRVASRTGEILEQASDDAIVVQDIPLLVENHYAPDFHLAVIVDAPEEERVRRLVARGLDESDARARIKAQATDEQRREAADVWLDNSRTAGELLGDVDRLWAERLVPFESNVRLGTHPRRGPARIELSDPEWPRAARRLSARIHKAAGERVLRVDHIGSTSVPDLAAKDVIDLQATVSSVEQADALAQPLTDAGFPPWDAGVTAADKPKPPDMDPAQWTKRTHVSADPGRKANLHIRVAGRANWRYALLFPAWLRDDQQARAEYESVKRDLAARFASDTSNGHYADTKQAWFDQTLPRAEQWAADTGWQPPEY